MQRIEESELILNPDGSIYHLNLLPEDIADTIITVGDPDRVAQVSKYFDSIELKKQKRELITHTGYVGKQRITVLSTGMSTGNIDIVFNELDALANIDFKQRTINPHLKSLDIIRIGTAGGLQPNIPLDSFVISTYGIGLDGLGSFYQMQNDLAESTLRQSFLKYFANDPATMNTYVARGSDKLINLFATEGIPGITVTCSGFYGPQGRILRAQPMIEHFIPKLQNFVWQEQAIANFEMETAGIYALGNILGHHCCSLSAIVANRCTQEFSTQPKEAVENLITLVLEKVSAGGIDQNQADLAKIAIL